MGLWIGVDYGTRRVGLAIADATAAIATPHATLPAAGNAPADARRIVAWAVARDPVGIVLGLPLNMDGTEGPQARLCRHLAEQLQTLTTLPVHLWDERLSSFQADETLDRAGVRRSRRVRLRDALAAQVILQSFLDARGAEPPP